MGAWTWHWRDAEAGKARATIRVSGRPDRITLNFSVDGTPVRIEARIAKTACNFGGARPRFECPCCGRRVARLFLPHRRFERKRPK